MTRIIQLSTSNEVEAELRAVLEGHGAILKMLRAALNPPLDPEQKPLRPLGRPVSKFRLTPELGDIGVDIFNGQPCDATHEMKTGPMYNGRRPYYQLRPEYATLKDNRQRYERWLAMQQELFSKELAQRHIERELQRGKPRRKELVEPEGEMKAALDRSQELATVRDASLEAMLIGLRELHRSLEKERKAAEALAAQYTRSLGK